MTCASHKIVKLERKNIICWTYTDLPVKVNQTVMTSYNSQFWRVLDIFTEAELSVCNIEGLWMLSDLECA